MYFASRLGGFSLSLSLSVLWGPLVPAVAQDVPDYVRAHFPSSLIFSRLVLNGALIFQNKREGWGGAGWRWSSSWCCHGCPVVTSGVSQCSRTLDSEGSC